MCCCAVLIGKHKNMLVLCFLIETDRLSSDCNSYEIQNAEDYIVHSQFYSHSKHIHLPCEIQGHISSKAPILQLKERWQSTHPRAYQQMLMVVVEELNRSKMHTSTAAQICSVRDNVLRLQQIAQIGNSTFDDCLNQFSDILCSKNHAAYRFSMCYIFRFTLLLRKKISPKL